MLIFKEYLVGCLPPPQLALDGNLFSHSAGPTVCWLSPEQMGKIGSQAPWHRPFWNWSHDKESREGPQLDLPSFFQLGHKEVCDN